MENKLIVAHRGHHAHHRENTLAAFQSAIDIGADMIEFDVHQTVDGNLVVNHDPLIDGLVIAETESGRLKERRPDLPFLADVLQLARNRARLDLEIKATGFESALLREISDSRTPLDQVIVTSFYPESIRLLSREITTGILIEETGPGENPWDRLIGLFHDTGAAVGAPHYTIIPEGPTDIPLLPWTVNDPDTIQKICSRPDVIGLITDDVATARRILGRFR